MSPAVKSPQAQGKVGIPTWMTSYLLSNCETFIAPCIISLIYIQGSIFQMKKELIGKVWSIRVRPDSTRQSQKTRLAARFHILATVVSLIHTDMKLQTCWAPHVCQKMYVESSGPEPTTFPTNSHAGCLSACASGLPALREAWCKVTAQCGPVHHPTAPCILAVSCNQPRSPACWEFSALGFFSEI